MGSNPTLSADGLRSHRLVVRTRAFQALNRGSIPRGSTLLEQARKLKMPTKITSKTEQNEITWRAAEYRYIKKGAGWYWLIGFIASALVVISLFQDNFFFAVFIVIAAAMLITLGGRKPQIFDFKINDKGVAIGDKIFYDYERLEGFTIRNRPEQLDEIVFKKKATINPHIKIPIDSKLAPKVKNILETKLPEIEYQESLIDIIFERFGL